MSPPLGNAFIFGPYLVEDLRPNDRVLEEVSCGSSPVQNAALNVTESCSQRRRDDGAPLAGKAILTGIPFAGIGKDAHVPAEQAGRAVVGDPGELVGRLICFDE